MKIKYVDNMHPLSAYASGDVVSNTACGVCLLVRKPQRDEVVNLSDGKPRSYDANDLFKLHPSAKLVL